MKNLGWLFRLSSPQSARTRHIAGGIGVAAMMMTAAIAVAQEPTPGAQPVAPNGYSLHETVDLGGHITNVYGSGAMYDTLVNLHSGPRVLGETFELRALPGTRPGLVDQLSAFSSGWGGDPYDFARMNFSKGKLYDFSGLFRRDRQYFDYDLLGNPNIPASQTIRVTGGAPLSWSQVNQSPFLFNTVRRMTDTRVTLLPLSKVSFRAGYTQDVFQGPSLTPSGFWEVTSPATLIYDTLLREMQRNSTDDFLGAIDWKPVHDTKLTFEEQIDHYKANSWFMFDPALFNVQEPDGTRAALLASYDSLTAPAVTCNANSAGTAPALSAPVTPGGLPVVNPACDVVTSYQRYQPTRILYPTEIFRFQSSGIRTLSMNGDIRYTHANMSLPNYYENLQGLLGAGKSGAERELMYSGTATAKREVTAIDYGIDWHALQSFGLSDAFTYSDAQQPGVVTMTGASALTTPATAGSESLAYNGPLSTVAAGAVPGNGAVGAPYYAYYGYFGQKFITNEVTATWYGWSRGIVSLTYLYRQHLIGEGESPTLAHNTPLTAGATTAGTVTINQNGGILNVAVRPAIHWDLNGSAEVSYSDNAFTPVAPRQLQHYRVHTIYRPKTWASLSGAFNDMELHNNTNNTGTAPLDGPLGHVAHSRVGSVGVTLFPNDRYGIDASYSYSDVYTSTNICYDAGAAPTLPGAASPSGTLCPGASVRGTNYYEFGPVRDFEDAPTQSGSVALAFSPAKALHSDVGYQISSVNGTRFYNDARDVAGSLVSNWQSPFVNVAWSVRRNWIWKAQYNYYGYGEGGPSGSPYCSTTNPTLASPAVPVVACNSPALAGLQTGLTLGSYGETAPRNFHANDVTLGFHYEF